MLEKKCTRTIHVHAEYIHAYSEKKNRIIKMLTQKLNDSHSSEL